jgi:hypothetical protein
MEETNISYNEFVNGVVKGTIRFEVVDKTGYVNLYYNTFVAVMMKILCAIIYSPVILIPVLSYVFNKAILLTGLLGFIFGFILHRLSLKINHPFINLVTATFLFGITATIFICFTDIMTPVTFILTYTIYQFFFLYLDDYFYQQNAKDILIRNCSNYNFAAKYNIIKTFRVSENQGSLLHVI